MRHQKNVVVRHRSVPFPDLFPYCEKRENKKMNEKQEEEKAEKQEEKLEKRRAKRRVANMSKEALQKC